MAFSGVRGIGRCATGANKKPARESLAISAGGSDDRRAANPVDSYFAKVEFRGGQRESPVPAGLLNHLVGALPLMFGRSDAEASGLELTAFRREISRPDFLPRVPTSTALMVGF